MSGLISVKTLGSRVTSISVDSVFGESIGFSYITLFDNKPNKYNNLVAIWKSPSPEIPWDVPPMVDKIAINDEPQYNDVLAGLSITDDSYILGYGVGPKKPEPKQTFGNICATAFIPAKNVKGRVPYDCFSTRISIDKPEEVQSHTVPVSYQTPAGYMPKTNTNWMGMWLGKSASYEDKPKYVTAIRSDEYAGTAWFTGIDIVRGGEYTIAYFMDGWDEKDDKPEDGSQQTMAATLTFKAD